MSVYVYLITYNLLYSCIAECCYSFVKSKPESLDTDIVLLVFRMERNLFTSEWPDWR